MRFLLRLSLFGLLSLVFVVSTFAQRPEKVWVEEDGVVIIEAEAVDTPLDSDNWELKTEPDGYTGSGYLLRTAWGNMYKDPLVFDALTDTTELLRYRVKINEPGEYAVHIRNRHEEEDGDNDVWVSVNGSPFDKVWDHDARAFTWSEYDKWTWTLESGINEITLAGRSAGFGIDRIVLHRTDVPKSRWGNPSAEPSELAMPVLSKDTTSPNPPQNVEVVDTELAAARLTWDDATDDNLVLGYDVYANGRQIGQTLQPPFVASDLTPGTNYRFTVRARDLAGNQSPHSSSASASTGDVNPEQVVPIKYVRRTPVIDGEFDFSGEEQRDLENWHNLALHPIDSVVSGQPDSTGDLDAAFRAAWDEDSLYVLVEAVDEVPMPNGEGDGFRLFLDPENDQSGTFGIDDRRYRFIGKDQLREGTQRDSYMEGVRAQLGGPPPPKRSWEETPSGWFVEMAFPWETLGVAPKEGMRIGMDFLVQDVDTAANASGESADYSHGGRADPTSGNETHVAWAEDGEDVGSSPYHLGTVQLKRELKSGSQDGYLPPQIWKEEDGAVVIEAEDIDYHENWVLRTTPSGFTGDGYLRWEGQNRMETPDGRGGNDDYTLERQGPQKEWLIVRVYTDNPGIYHIDARNHHVKEDGDNDAWVWRVGRPVTDWSPVFRMGDSLEEGKGFSWLDWGVRSFWLKEGINNLYIGGRSYGFGIDRIALYRDGDSEAKERALDPDTPPSPRVDK